MINCAVIMGRLVADPGQNLRQVLRYANPLRLTEILSRQARRRAILSMSSHGGQRRLSCANIFIRVR